MGSKSNNWSDSGAVGGNVGGGGVLPQPTATTSELWGAPMSKTTARGPPPGLAGKGIGNGGGSGSTSVGTNGWIGSSLSAGGNGRQSGVGVTNWSSGSGGQSNAGGWHSTWLLLKNLTAQVSYCTMRLVSIESIKF